ncbi:MAG: hypothetical protein ACKVOB_07545 [Sphingomonas sp.]
MRVTSTVSAAAIIVAAAGVPSTACAQSSSKAESEVTVSLGGRYDGNVSRRSPAQAALLNLTPEDAVLTPNVDVHLARPVGRNLFSLDAGLGYVLYRRNTRLNREQISVDATADLSLGPCQLVLSPGYRRGQSDLSQIAGAFAAAAGSINNTQSTQEYAGDLRCGSRRGFRPIATISRTIGDNSNPLRRISDYRTFSYGGGLGYSNPVIGDYSVIYNRADTTYPTRTAATGGTGFVLDRITVSGGRSIGSGLRAAGTVSFLALNPKQPGVRNFNSVGWSLSATLLPTPDLQLQLETSRDIKPSLGSDALFQVFRSYSLNAAYAFSSSTRASVGGSINEVTYNGAGTTFGPALTNSVQYSATGSVTQDFGRRLGLTAELGYDRRNANGSLFDYDRFFAGLKLIFRI